MLVVLALIDVVMISNLLIMVIVGGYETFVSRWTWKVTLTSPSGSATSTPRCSRSNWPLPSSASAPSTCSRPSSMRPITTQQVLIAQTAIHITFLLSAMAIAYTDRLMSHSKPDGTH
jgi:uncharacterized membrane protein YqhA